MPSPLGKGSYVMTIIQPPTKQLPIRADCVITYRLGFWAAFALAVGGAIYATVIGVAAATGRLVMPPSQSLQLFGGIATFAFAPLLVVLMACLHDCAPSRKKIWSHIAFAFTVLFAAMVSINRFVQLSVVRKGMTSGRLDDLRLFLPYDTGSIMFALEILGWAFFLSLALLSAAPLFSSGRIHRWLRGLCLAYGILGLTSAFGYLFASPIAAVGFIAWGPILDLIAILLCLFFRSAKLSA